MHTYMNMYVYMLTYRAYTSYIWHIALLINSHTSLEVSHTHTHTHTHMHACMHI